MLHGEEVDWSDEKDIRKSLTAYAIRTDRSSLEVKLLPIEVKLVRRSSLLGERRRLADKYASKIARTIGSCLDRGQPTQIRQNASYALIHFANLKLLGKLQGAALTDSDPFVRFNCSVALMAANTRGGVSYMRRVLKEISDAGIVKYGKSNIERIKKAKRD